jgi:rubredoxin
MYKAEKNDKTYPTKKYKLSVCKICGHTRWSPLDMDEFENNFMCPFCKSPKEAFIDFGTETFNNVRHDFIHLAEGVFYIRQNPPFPSPFKHNAYFIEHEKGNILFDVPMFLNKSLFKEIEKRGELRYIIHSHNHFVGASRLLCERFLAQSWLGKDDKPISGNLNYPDYWMIKDEHIISDNKCEIIVKKFSGHTKGSYVMYIKRNKEILLTGDSIYVNHSKKEKASNIFIFSKEKPDELDWAYGLKLDYLGSNGGFVRNAKYYLDQLKISKSPFSIPMDKKLKRGVLLSDEDTTPADIL